MPKTVGPNIKSRQRLPDQIERGSINILECELTKDGAAITPTSATIVITDGSGVTQASGSATIVGSVAQYSWTPASTLILSDRWSVVWSITTPSDGVQVIRNDAMLCRYRLTCPITVEDVYGIAPALDPSNTTCILANSDADVDNLVSEAWIQVQSRLLAAGKRPYLVTGAFALRDCVLNLSLALAFDTAALHTLNQAWQDTANRYRQQYEESWKNLKLSYDEDDSAVDRQMVSARPGVIWLGARR